MTDSGIKKAKILVNELPTISSQTQGYTLRYRMISEDKNRVSHWSPFHLIVPGYTYVPESIKFSSANQVASITWDSVNILKDTATIQEINNKVLNTNIATITTAGAHYMQVNDWVTVSGVDATFNGTHEIAAVTANTFSYYKNSGNVASTAVSPLGTYKRNSLIQKAKEYDIWVRWDRGESEIATVTNISASAGTITYTATNTFSVGDIVTINGVVPNQYNLTNATIATASGSNFTITNSATGTFVSGGAAETQGGDWVYKERIDGTSISFPHPSIYRINGAIQASAPNRVSFEIFLKGYPIARAGGVPLGVGTPFLKVYRLLNQTI